MLAGTTATTSPLAHRIENWIFPRVSAQTYSSEGPEPINGIGVWSAWDDGDDSTWEGGSYFENYDTGQWASVDKQMNITTDHPWVTWTDTRSFEPRDRTREGAPAPAPVAYRPIRLDQGISDPSACACTGQRRQLPANCMMSLALDRSAIHCGVTFGGCALSGPKYMACVAALCGGRIAWEFLAELYRWGRDCRNI